MRRQAEEDILRKRLEIQDVFAKMKIRNTRRAAMRDTRVDLTLNKSATADAETVAGEQATAAEASLRASDTPWVDALDNTDETFQILYMTEALEATDQSRCAQRCTSCVYYHRNDRNSKYSLSYYLSHLSSERHQECRPIAHLEPETCNYLQRIARQETPENSKVTGLAMITALAALTPVINPTDLDSCVASLLEVSTSDCPHRLYQLVIRHRLLQSGAAYLELSILDIITQYTYLPNTPYTNGLHIGPTFNYYAITERPLLSSFVHRNPRNAKEDAVNFCAQIILLNHQMNQVQWEAVDLPAAKETKVLLQMLICDILTRKGNQPTDPTKIDPNVPKERRGDIVRYFSGRTERHLWLHNSWGT
jgi:hypothetical protein